MPDDTLTLEKLEALVRALAPPPEPKWATMLRKAHAVVVRVTTLLPNDDSLLYVLDPNNAIVNPRAWAVAALPPSAKPYPTMLLCRPEHETIARDILKALGVTPIEDTRPALSVPVTVLARPEEGG